MKFNLIIILLVFIQSCSSPAQVSQSVLSEEFRKYWFEGKAELNSFQVEQERYGELRKGTTTLIFVTEDFNSKSQVKSDNPSKAGKNKLPVMKMNKNEKFITGIYDYSIMSSSFVRCPAFIEKTSIIKSSCSIQEWCGQTYFQLNNRNKKMQLEGRSYFETEGDQNISFPATYTEDEIFLLIRQNPMLIPQGKLKVVPGFNYLRLRHKKLEPTNAIIIKDDVDVKTAKVKIEYPEHKRIFTIFYERNFPYKINSWEETLNGKSMQKAISIKCFQDDYWNHNGTQFESLRKDLGI
jgi:hypothetical protein